MMSSSLVSAISTSPCAAATAARPRRDPAAAAAAAATRQLRIKAKHAGYSGCCCCQCRGRAVVTRAGPGPLTEIEPDLQEDPIDKWRTNGVSPEDFVYGVYDGHHTYHETQDKKGFWEDVSEWYQEAEPPQGFQGSIQSVSHLDKPEKNHIFFLLGKACSFALMAISCSTHLLAVSSCNHAWHGFQCSGNRQ
ncbi:hypothetical protein GUJ93_ZPchr0001g32966 [Zizania palustris]|uniref:Uncharacterized protein n=1 Tax=Zizania palustris TaxID=103762 RepID=A0A8J5VNF8_ZIZPA|nr:hypothetical protein GUJ93_ZPchr0001g32966 [Zizania palustris]